MLIVSINNENLTRPLPQPTSHKRSSLWIMCWLLPGKSNRSTRMFAARNDIFEIIGWIGWVQWFRSIVVKLASKHSTRYIFGAVWTENAERGCWATRTTIARDVMDWTYAHHTDQTKNISTFCNAIHSTTKCCWYYDTIADAHTRWHHIRNEWVVICVLQILLRFSNIPNFFPFFLFSDSNLASVIEGAPMSRSSFASFHLTGIKPSSGKLMTSSVDRLFENDGDVFISSNYNDFNQVSMQLCADGKRFANKF